MRLIGRRNKITIDLTTDEAELVSSLLLQFDLVLESYLTADKDAETDLLTAEFSNCATAPEDPMLAILVPQGATDPAYADYYRFATQAKLLHSLRAAVRDIIAEFHGIRYSDHHLRQELNELQQQSPACPTAEESAATAAETEPATALTENEIADFKTKLHQTDKLAGSSELSDVLENTAEHSITIDLGIHTALQWVRALSCIRLTVAAKFDGADRFSLCDDELEWYEAVHEWLTIVVDSMSQALLLARE